MLMLSSVSTSTAPLFPYTTLCRSSVELAFRFLHDGGGVVHVRGACGPDAHGWSCAVADVTAEVEAREAAALVEASKIERANVCTTVTKEQNVCRLLLETKKQHEQQSITKKTR